MACRIGFHNSGGGKAAPGCLRAGKGDAGTGRKRMKACERKDETITVRCTAEEKADLKEIAGKRGNQWGVSFWTPEWPGGNGAGRKTGGRITV